MRPTPAGIPFACVLTVLASLTLACATDSVEEPPPHQTSARPSLAFVAGGSTAFWEIATAGAVAGGKDFDADVEASMPEGVAHQNGILRELLSRAINGTAVSPMNPGGQLSLLNELATHAPLVTHDSDAPESRRLCFIGVDNYMAGRLCGRLVKEALPEGGTVAILVGRLEQLNAQQRRQGLIDELLDRPIDEDRRVFERYFPAQRYAKSGSIEGERFTVVGTFTDGLDLAEAERQADQVLTTHPDLDGIVGLFSYNVPVALRALEKLDRVGELAIVAFDEDQETLQAIADGYVYGTVVQNPFRYGHDSIRILAALARGDRSVLPEGGFLDVPPRQVTADNVAEFQAELEELTLPN